MRLLPCALVRADLSGLQVALFLPRRFALQHKDLIAQLCRRFEFQLARRLLHLLGQDRNALLLLPLGKLFGLFPSCREMRSVS